MNRDMIQGNMTTKPRILLVDDDSTNLDVMSAVLQEEPYHLTQVTSGTQALEVLRNSARGFDVIVLDRMMTGTNGLEVMAELKTHEALQWIPVIMATAAGSPQEICEGIEAGVFFYLVKPFDAHTLVRMVRAALAERMKWVAIQRSLSAPLHSVQFLQQGQFHIRTMEEAYALAIFLGQGCQEPDKVAFGLNELLCNAVEHGNLGIDFEEKTRLQAENRWEEELAHRMTLQENLLKTVRVQLERIPEALTFLIVDEGPGFDWTQYEGLHPERLLESHGRGIAMAKAMSFQKMKFLGKGNQVWCQASSKSADRIHSDNPAYVAHTQA